MNQSANAMYTIQDDAQAWTAFVYCTILDANGEHGWYGKGVNELAAIEELQDYMRAA